MELFFKSARRYTGADFLRVFSNKKENLLKFAPAKA
jgi:hypothetical protein